jgi:hypothetical protein
MTPFLQDQINIVKIMYRNKCNSFVVEHILTEKLINKNITFNMDVDADIKMVMNIIDTFLEKYHKTFNK